MLSLSCKCKSRGFRSPTPTSRSIILVQPADQTIQLLRPNRRVGGCGRRWEFPSYWPLILIFLSGPACRPWTSSVTTARLAELKRYGRQSFLSSWPSRTPAPRIIWSAPFGLDRITAVLNAPWKHKLWTHKACRRGKRTGFLHRSD